MNVDVALNRFLWRYGYFWAHDSGRDIRFEDVDSLRPTDRCVREAVATWQAADANFDLLSQVVHGRATIPDGDAGPVTEAMLSVPRCDVPDYAPPEGVTVGHLPMRLAARATGSGSWPVPGCDPSHPSTHHSIRIAIDTTNCPATVKTYLAQSLAAVTRAYAEVGLATRYMLHAGARPDCEIDKRFEPLGGSVIGWNEFPNPGTCQQTIDGRLSTGYTPSDWRMWANLECHETGHGVGLQHGRGSIMNPSILLVWPLTWVGTYSYPNLQRWFGGQPLEPPPPPTDPKWAGVVYADQMPSGLIAIRGEVSCDGEKAIIVPDGAGRYRPVSKWEL